MRFRDIIGQSFRDASGMPPKVRTFDSRLKVYDGIADDISEVESLVVKFFEESRDMDWSIIQAQKMKLQSDMVKGNISTDDYVLQSSILCDEEEDVKNDFISSTNQYFVTAYRNKLNYVKKNHRRDPYIEPMEFDTWFQMKVAREVAKLASLQIRCSDEYVDANKIAEIYERYKRDRHMRRGR